MSRQATVRSALELQGFSAELIIYAVYECDAPECKVLQTIGTNFVLLYTRFGLADTGGQGNFLMIMSGLVSSI